MGVKQLLRNTWLHPRYIGVVQMRSAMEQAGKWSQGVLLDVGCGLRPYEDLFFERITEYIGLDWPNLSYRVQPDVVSDAMHLPIANGAVDTVMATELMEHLPSPERFITEAARVLRSGGTLIVSVPLMEPLHEEPRDYFRFTPYGLRYLLERHSFVFKRIWNRGGWWSVVLGYFVSRSLYDWANPPDAEGRRKYGWYHWIKILSVLPLCAFAQLAAHMLDRTARSPKYTLGYVAVATLTS